ncbi:MAG: Maf family protein [Firmicutes bacterium]|nr:Maf family protein [Bacillota bacterium]
MSNDLQKRFDDGEIIEFDEPTIVLASASPRRARHLEEEGIKFVKILSSVDDADLNYEHPHEGVSKKQEKEYAKKMALAKLEPFIGRIKNGAVIAADTTVLCKGRILEKPLTKEMCREQHELLSGRTNIVYTSIAIYYNGRTYVKTVAYKTKVKKIPSEVIDEICEDELSYGAAGYRSAGPIAPFLVIKNVARDGVAGLDPKVVVKMLRKLGFQI